jgi:hypothetical protein
MSWNLSDLKKITVEHENWVVGEEDNCLCITNEDGLDAYLAVSGDQIIVESILFSKNQVSDVARLNEEILSTHQIFPLTTVSTTSIDGEEYYLAFGALSSQSKEESIIIEITSLFNNVSGFLEAYEDYLK